MYTWELGETTSLNLHSFSHLCLLISLYLHMSQGRGMVIPPLKEKLHIYIYIGHKKTLEPILFEKEIQILGLYFINLKSKRNLSRFYNTNGRMKTVCCSLSELVMHEENPNIPLFRISQASIFTPRVKEIPCSVG